MAFLRQTKGDNFFTYKTNSLGKCDKLSENSLGKCDDYCKNSLRKCDKYG